MIAIPTIKQLYDDILSDLQNELGITIPNYGKNFLRALAAVQAAKLKLYYLSIGKLQKNIFIDTADRESSGGTLERFGRIKLGRNPFPATQGQYTITVTGNAGATVPAQTTFKSNDDTQNPGKLFVLDAAYTMPGATGTMTVRALEAGLESRLNVGEGLTATAPLSAIDSGAVVASEFVIPQAAEDIEDYRQKGLDSYRLEPQGGAAADYRLWGLDAQGVKQIYPYAKSGAANEINVFVEATIADSVDGKGTPTATILNEVADDIELDPDTTLPISERGRRPLGVFAVNVLPVVIRQVDIVVTGYQNLTVDKQNIILASLSEMINAKRPFIAGADILAERNDVLGVNNIISTILSAVTDSVFTSVTLNVDSISVINIQFDNGNIPYLNSVSYA